MSRLFLLSLAIFACTLANVTQALGQGQIPQEITTPDSVQSKLGNLDFKDGYPSPETAEKIRDELDYLHGVEAFMN